jgi:hypothetical protein
MVDVDLAKLRVGHIWVNKTYEDSVIVIVIVIVVNGSHQLLTAIIRPRASELVQEN